ncbi:MAG TPA: lamin tail domain-containing protein [Candidatus Pacearchaeota archaeon]|nr:lamin tail domain-containing protein [Candidatus Pacearchaeota archaeon]
MRTGILILVLIIFIPNVSALKITEFESNPVGGREGTEWIELYNDEGEDLDVSDWKIHDNIGERHVFDNGTIISSEEYYVVEFSNPVLNNGGDFIILYDATGTKIDETETLEESESGSKTWQLCDSWEFKSSTKGEENSCEEETLEEDPEEEPEEEVEEKTKEKKVVKKYREVVDPQVKEETEPIELEMINLNPKVIKTGDFKEELDKGNSYAIYGFAAFCILMIALFMLRKNKYKNEFN